VADSFAGDELILPYKMLAKNETVYHFCELHHASNRHYKN
jgi:hypothetical protein